MKRPPANAIALLVCLLTTCVLAGCVTQSERRVSPSPQAGDRITPRVGLEAPTDLHDISGYLLRYRVSYQILPASLADLRATQIMPDEGYPGLSDYAYQASGLGTLSDGRRIIVVDTTIRIEGHAWCILAEPSRNPRTATLAVSLVPMSQLDAAASRERR